MSDHITLEHLERLESAVFRKHSMSTLAAYITEHTFMHGQPYSFVDHEFQAAIVGDTSQEVNVRKCAQVGVSETSARLALAMVDVLSPFTVAYTLPTAGFSGTFTRTRIDPIIDGSKRLKGAVHTSTNNSEVKRFGDSYLYMRGAASSNAPISIPVDCLIHDEFDFCDMEVLKQYQSRLRHSKYKYVRRFSTPTLPDFGIDKEFKVSRRYFNLCKCDKCNHWFQPDYYKHVKVPGYDGAMEDIEARMMSHLRWREAYLACPNCGRKPDLGPAHREYVCENPDDSFIAAGYQVSPFDAPKIMKPSDLVKESVAYERTQDFKNFGLGLPADDKEATLDRNDFADLFIQEEAGSGAYVMGVDIGKQYHFVIGRVDGYGNLYVVHTELVPMGKARDKYQDFRRKYRIICTVMDSAPHAETVMTLQTTDPNMYASVYVEAKSFLTHTIVNKEDKKDEGTTFQRQVNVNRNRSLDGYMAAIRNGEVKFRMEDEDRREEIIVQHCSMKRTKQYENQSEELVYKWQKTDGNDHWHHASLYCWTAARIKGLGGHLIELPLARAFSFRVKT